MANLEVKCNFASVFAKYDTVEELKAIANNICGQVKTAYEARIKEITSGQTGVVVEVTTPKTEAKSQKEKTVKTKEAVKKQAEPVKTTTKTKPDKDTDTLISITDIKAIKELGLTFEKYNDRCWVLRGNTKPLRKVLKDQFKGVFNSHLTGGEGWVIKTANVDECAKALGIKVKAA